MTVKLNILTVKSITKDIQNDKKNKVKMAINGQHKINILLGTQGVDTTVSVYIRVNKKIKSPTDLQLVQYDNIG